MVSALLEPRKETLERGEEPLVEPSQRFHRSTLSNIVNFSPKASAVVQLERLGHAFQGLAGAVKNWFGSKSVDALTEVKKRDQTFLSLTREAIDRQLTQNIAVKNGDTTAPEISHALAERQQLHHQIIKEMVEPLIQKEADAVQIKLKNDLKRDFMPLMQRYLSQNGSSDALLQRAAQAVKSGDPAIETLIESLSVSANERRLLSETLKASRIITYHSAVMRASNEIRKAVENMPLLEEVRDIQSALSRLSHRTPLGRMEPEYTVKNRACSIKLECSSTQTLLTLELQRPGNDIPGIVQIRLKPELAENKAQARALSKEILHELSKLPQNNKAPVINEALMHRLLGAGEITTLSHVRIREANLTGVLFEDTLQNDVEYTNCKLVGSTVRGGTMTRVRFNYTNSKDFSRLDYFDAKGATLDSETMLNLTRAEEKRKLAQVEGTPSSKNLFTDMLSRIGEGTATFFKRWSGQRSVPTSPLWIQDVAHSGRFAPHKPKFIQANHGLAVMELSIGGGFIRVSEVPGDTKLGKIQVFQNEERGTNSSAPHEVEHFEGTSAACTKYLADLCRLNPTTRKKQDSQPYLKRLKDMLLEEK